MTSEKMLDAFGDISEEIIEEANPRNHKTSKKLWIRWGAAAAACLAITAIAYNSPLFNPSGTVIPPNSSAISIPQSNVPTQDINTPQVTQSGKPAQSNLTTPNSNSTQNITPTQSGNAVQSSAPEQSGNTEGNTPSQAKPSSSLQINELSVVPSFSASTIALKVDDFVSMTDDQLLKYYGISLPIEQTLSNLKKQAQDSNVRSGIYKSDSRGVYFDTNAFLFANLGRSQEIKIVLAKNHLPYTDINNAYGRELKESTIGGIGMILAHYSDSANNSVHYAQFIHSGVGYDVFATNITQDDFAKVLTALVA